ncbi:MAG TPA: TCR/Tet family MFS transporter [Bdellovibrionales bacterium]|nr:TCR/Tet family MFS transporter [Bdellovibrionales bacterium]
MQTTPKLRQAAFIFIFITVVLDILALGIIIPVLPGLVAGFTGGDTARAAEMYGLFGTVWAAMQFVSAPVLGSLSDRFGRRPVILLSNFGLGLDYIFMALAPTLGWLFVGRVVSGISAASIPTAGAYISDVTAPEKRAASFGLLGAAFGLGFVMGPALGGILGDIDPRLPFWVAAGLSLLNATYGVFVLPESLPPEKRAPFRWARANPVGSLKLLRSHPQLLGLGAVAFLSALAHEVLPSTAVLYTGYRYGWGPKDVGILLAGVGVCSAIVQAGLVRPVVARFGERRSLIAGFTFGAAGFAVYGWADQGWLYVIGVPLMALWGIGMPAAQGLMSTRVSPSEQGQLQGAIGSLRGIAGLFGPGIFTLTFSSFISRPEGLKVPGAPFYLAASLLLMAVATSWLATRARPEAVITEVT